MIIEQHGQATMQGDQHSILLVDDSSVNLGLVVENLELQGYEVLVAQDGEEALQRAHITLPDIILLDVMMPGMDGFEVCRRLKADERTRDIPVIFMTSLGRLEDKIEGFAAGAVDYVTKPLQMDELRARVGVHLKLRDLQRQLAEKNLRLESEIEQRRQMETLLEKREREFRTLAENSPDIIVRYDHDCRFVYVSPRFEEMLGFPLEALRGKQPTQVAGLPQAEFFQQRVLEVAATGRADEFEHLVQTPEGPPIWMLVSIFPELDEAGRIGHVQVLSRNITALKEAEQGLEESRAKLRQLLAHQEESREQERKHISWGMHEDLLQILSAMHMYATLLQSSASGMPAHLAQSLPAMMSGLDKSIAMVREMVATLRPTVLNLGIAAALEWLADDFTGQPGMACRLALAPEAEGMDEKCCLVFFRIAQEALAFTAQHRETALTSIALGRGPTDYVLEIRDKGKGGEIAIPDDKFFGLFGLQERVIAMGGEMLVFSAPGHGLIVEARLPAHELGRMGEGQRP